MASSARVRASAWCSGVFTAPVDTVPSIRPLSSTRRRIRLAALLITCLIHLPAVNRFSQQGIVFSRTGHFQVQPALDRLEDGVVGAPVGDDRTFEAPFLLEDFVQHAYRSGWHRSR